MKAGGAAAPNPGGLFAELLAKSKGGVDGNLSPSQMAAMRKVPQEFSVALRIETRGRLIGFRLLLAELRRRRLLLVPSLRHLV